MGEASDCFKIRLSWRDFLWVNGISLDALFHKEQRQSLNMLTVSLTTQLTLKLRQEKCLTLTIHHLEDFKNGKQTIPRGAKIC